MPGIEGRKMFMLSAPSPAIATSVRIAGGVRGSNIRRAEGAGSGIGIAIRST